MSEINRQQNEGADTSSTGSAMSNFLRQQLPYIIVLVLAIVGVAYTNVSHQPLVGYWEFLALAIAAVCIITKWPELDKRQTQLRSIFTTARHSAMVRKQLGAAVARRAPIHPITRF